MATATKFFIRKHRKWPVPPYNTKHHKLLNQHKALQTLKHSLSLNASSPKTLLPTLIDSFNAFNTHPTPQAYSFLLKTLLETTPKQLITTHIASILNHLHSVQDFQPPESIFADLITFYGSVGLINDAVCIFFDIPNYRCVPSAVSLNALLCVLCGASGDLEMVPKVLMESRKMGVRLEESSFRILIAALCRSGRVGYGIEILRCMIGDGCAFDAKIGSLVLVSLCKEKGVSGLEVVGFLEEMKKVGFRPRMLDYSYVIRCLVRRGKASDALGVLGMMKGEGMKPDVVCYTMVLYGVISIGDYEIADKVFDELLVLGLVPDVCTYNVYISGLCKQKNVGAGMKMVACMEELGCKPSLITYNLLLKALCKNGEVSRARELVREMCLNGVEMNFQTHRILLDGLFRRSDIDDACTYMEDMLEKFPCRCCKVYDDIISGLCQKGLVCRAMESLQKMADKNVLLGARAWESLLLSSDTRPYLVETTWASLVNPRKTI